jgi:hydrogenase nickel incorporation protein HypA/HybF
MQRRGREGTLHELSVMSQVVESIVKLARSKGAKRVVSVRLQVGELTFLAEDQMRFAFQIISGNEGPFMHDAELILEPLAARGACPSCDFSGPLPVVELPDSHITTPVINCPNCETRVDVTEGRDLLIRDIQLELPEDEDVGGGGQVDG